MCYYKLIRYNGTTCAVGGHLESECEVEKRGETCTSVVVIGAMDLLIAKDEEHQCSIWCLLPVT